MGKKTIAVAISAAVLAIASPAFAGGVSGSGGLYTQIQAVGPASTMSMGNFMLNGAGPGVSLDAGGMLGTSSFGFGVSNTSANVGAGGSAYQDHHTASAEAGSSASTSSFSVGNVITNTYASGGAATSAFGMTGQPVYSPLPVVIPTP